MVAAEWLNKSACRLIDICWLMIKGHVFGKSYFKPECMNVNVVRPGKGFFRSGKGSFERMPAH
jgi:hypothetical protein